MSRLRAATLVSLIYVAGVLALTYPLVLELGTSVPSDPGDPFLTSWILWWNSRVLPYTQAWWDAPSFFPSPDSLALSEHLFGLSVFTTPIIWFSDNVRLAYNVAFLLTFVFSALAGYILGLTITKRSDAAFVLGLAFAFAPYRMANFPHIQTLASFWMPLALAALHKYVTDGRAHWLVLFGVSTLAQGLTNAYYLLFFPVLVGMWLFWFIPGRQPAGRLVAIASTLAIGLLPLVPILLHYRSVHERLGLRRFPDEVLTFSADITALVRATSDLIVWGRWLPSPGPEAPLFPGLAVVVLVIVGLVWGERKHGVGRGSSSVTPRVIRWARRAVGLAAILTSVAALTVLVFGPWSVDFLGMSVSANRLYKLLSETLLFWLAFALLGPGARRVWRSRSPFAFYTLATLVMWMLSFGPEARLLGHRVLYWPPYRVLTLLPGFDGVRVPARFGMLAVLCLAASASLALARLLPRVSRAGQVQLIAIVAAAILADGWLRAMPLVKPPIPSIVAASDEPGAVLELPLGDPWRDVAAMYRSIDHRRPVVNGFSGYGPPHYDILRFALPARDHSALQELATRGLRHIVIFDDGDPDRSLRTYVETYPGATFVRASNGQVHYRVAPTEHRRDSSSVRSTVALADVRAASGSELVHQLHDGNLATFWTSGHPQTGAADEQVLLDLGAVRSVSGVDMMLGADRPSYPRQLAVEHSPDRYQWSEVWRGASAGLAIAGALDDPRSVPLRVRFSPVRCRYLRLRQLGSDPVFFWSIAELAVVGQALP